MDTAPTSIDVLLRPTQSQSDEPSDLRGHPFNYETGATLLNFSDHHTTYCTVKDAYVK